MKYWTEAINKYANFSGRTRRREFWYFILWQAIFGLTIAALAILAQTLDGDIVAANVVRVFGDLFALLTLIPTLAISVRRLHDTGKPGWLALLAFIPLAGIVVLLFCLRDSEPRFNRWGPNPKAIDPALVALP